MASALELWAGIREDLLWRMFASLGVPAQATPFEQTAVDPECVLVLGAACSEKNPRAAELVLWFGEHAQRSLSTTRAHRIARIVPYGEVALAKFAVTARDLEMPALRQWSKRFVRDGVQPWGDRYDVSRLSERLGADLADSISQPAAFRLRMRLALGVGARTEALAMLLVERAFWRERGVGWLTLPKIEAGTGYQKRFLLDSVLDMASSGLIEHRREGRSHMFAARPEMVDLIPDIPSVWTDWPPRIALLEQIGHALSALDADPSITSALAAAREMTQIAPLVSEYDPPRDPNLIVQHFETWCVNAARWLVDVP